LPTAFHTDPEKVESKMKKRKEKGKLGTKTIKEIALNRASIPE